MIYTQATCLELAGTNYEIGRRMGEHIKRYPKPGIPQQPCGLGAQDMIYARHLLEQWCSGINEEIEGVADVLGFPPEISAYYTMTYLVPRCSQAVVLPQRTENRHTMLARSYEFSPAAEDFILARTSVKGKYTHIGTTAMQLGRDEGVNECGLAVTMSSCGLPVGAPKGMRASALRGLQFWAVIRTLLENCADVAQAIDYLDGMPIAYNINLILADKAGNAALFETLDGETGIRQIGADTQEQYLFATNHAALPLLIRREPFAMRHSLVRYEKIRNFLETTQRVDSGLLRKLLHEKYPQGLYCPYYKDFFGTTKSMLLDVNDGTIELCWGGIEQNGWKCYGVDTPLKESRERIAMEPEPSPRGLYEALPLREETIG